MTQTLAAVSLALLLTGSLSPLANAAPVRVAYLYCDWPDGQASFKDEFDQAFAALGWQVTKFENKQAKDLSGRLGDFDVVVGGGVSNLTNPQDFKPFAAQWQAFLEGGGVVLATDASYAGINASWIGGLDSAFGTTSAMCSAHKQPSPETAAVRFSADDPLLSVPADLRAGLAAKANWAHLEQVGPGWVVDVRCFDDQPLFVHRAVGKGLLIVTSYFRFMGPGPAATALLRNAMALAKTNQQGLRLLSLTPPGSALGRNRTAIRLRNALDQPAKVSARLSLTGKAPLPPATIEQTLPAQGDGELLLNYDLPVRGEYHGALELLKDGNLFLTAPYNPTVPELVRVTVRSRHQYLHYGTLTARVTLAPELAERLKGLTVSLQLVGGKAPGKPAVVKPTALQFEQTLPLAGLKPDSYRLVASLGQDAKELGRGDVLVLLHSEPTVKFNDKGVCYVRGKPFFPLGMYHVAWGASREEMLKCVEDLAAAGFNAVHTSCTNLEVFQEVLDKAQTLGLHVLPEGVGATSPGLQRFKDHPAILAWNSGDELDCANVSPEKVGEAVDAIRDVDPNHLIYTTVANPALLSQYAPCTDVLSNDPYPLANGKIDTLAVASATARARAAVGPGRALWMVPQCFGYAKGPWQVPTPAQERSMTYQALIEGANGLIWYVYDDKQFKVLDHPDLWAMMQQLTAEVKALTPILFEPAQDGQRFATGPDDCLRGVSIKQDRELTILTAHTNEKDLGQQELAAPGLPATGRAEVLFENRTLNVGGGKIRDGFAPYAVHVYRVKLP